MPTQLLLFNKPFGVLSQFTSQTCEVTLANYIKQPGFYPAGRLDKNSEGLLLLTNCGRLQQQLSHPKFNKKKSYWVQVEGLPNLQDLMPLTLGLRTPKICYLPAEVTLITPPVLWTRNPPIRERQTIPTRWLNIVIKEGKNHQIRKMTAAIGFPTLRLIRHQVDKWQLNNLRPGEYLLKTLDFSKPN